MFFSGFISDAWHDISFTKHTTGIGCCHIISDQIISHIKALNVKKKHDSFPYSSSTGPLNTWDLTCPLLWQLISFQPNVLIHLQAQHYSDVIMSMMASQITGVSTVCWCVCSGADKKNIKALHHWLLCGVSTSNWWIPFTKGQLCRKFSIWWRHNDTDNKVRHPFFQIYKAVNDFIIFYWLYDICQHLLDLTKINHTLRNRLHWDNCWN